MPKGTDVTQSSTPCRTRNVRLFVERDGVVLFRGVDVWVRQRSVLTGPSRTPVYTCGRDRGVGDSRGVP